MLTLYIGRFENLGFYLVKNIDDVRRFVDNFTELSGHKGLGDLSLLTEEAQSVLLKFIEEFKGDFFCYASRDSLTPVLMSRFQKIVKNEDLVINTGGFQNFVLPRIEGGAVDSNAPRDLLSKSASCLDSYMVYRRLGRGVIQRVGKFL